MAFAAVIEADSLYFLSAGLVTSRSCSGSRVQVSVRLGVLVRIQIKIKIKTRSRRSKLMSR